MNEADFGQRRRPVIDGRRGVPPFSFSAQVHKDGSLGTHAVQAARSVTATQ